MNVQRHSPSSTEDLDSTAELPVLDVAALEAAADPGLGSTDTWMMPPPTLRGAADLGEPADLTGTAYEPQEVGLEAHTDVRPESENESRPASRTELETNLRALSANLGDVEERLKRKVELLAENERALESARSERAAAQQRAAALAQDLVQARAAEAVARASIAELEQSLVQRGVASETAARTAAGEIERAHFERDAAGEALTRKERELEAKIADYERVLAGMRRELDATHARATAYYETLQTREGQRAVFDNLFLGLQSELDQGHSRLAALEKEIAAAAVRKDHLESRLSGKRERVAQLEKEAQELAANLAQRDVQLQKARADADDQGRNAASLAEKLAKSLERLGNLEAAAAGRDAVWSERDVELQSIRVEREALRSQIAMLEAALASATAAGGEHEEALQVVMRSLEEAEASMEKQQLRSGQLENELTTVRAEMSEWGAALKEATEERSGYVARLAAQDERIRELSVRVEDQQELVRIHQAESNSSLARTREIEADLRVAEEAIHRLESDLRAKNSRVEELERTNNEWHAKVDAARLALNEREALIQRLEDEACNSNVLLGQIQQSMKRLDPANSGTHEAIPEAMPEGATRLLIRTDGQREVVHVLGRKTSIGRTPDNDLQIDAKFISRHHAVILAGPARTIIEDLNSTNGVLVNNRRITRQVLEDGDDVVVGRTRFRFALRQPVERR